eukprot:scaffold5441_cov97-Isochrysis_galbana.AAC.1
MPRPSHPNSRARCRVDPPMPQPTSSTRTVTVVHVLAPHALPQRAAPVVEGGDALLELRARAVAVLGGRRRIGGDGGGRHGARHGGHAQAAPMHWFQRAHGAAAEQQSREGGKGGHRGGSDAKFRGLCLHRAADGGDHK